MIMKGRNKQDDRIIAMRGKGTRVKRRTGEKKIAGIKRYGKTAKEENKQVQERGETV
jgi:DNA-binding GntR family transcriptional regulator